jgi:hypothetical protein
VPLDPQVDTVFVQVLDTVFLVSVDTVFATDTVPPPNGVWFDGQVHRANGAPDTGAYVEVRITQTFLPLPSTTSVLYTRAKEGHYRLGWDSRHCEFGNGTTIQVELFGGAGENLAVPAVTYTSVGVPLTPNSALGFCGRTFANDFVLPY